MVILDVHQYDLNGIWHFHLTKSKKYHIEITKQMMTNCRYIIFTTINTRSYILVIDAILKFQKNHLTLIPQKTDIDIECVPGHNQDLQTTMHNLDTLQFKISVPKRLIIVKLQNDINLTPTYQVL